jgi:uncharacterized protein YjbJ (UPF0337 family)
MTYPIASPHNVENDSYDAHLVPPEVTARKEREGDNYKKLPHEVESDDSVNASGGHTMDSEGLANNYAIEPEMYYEEPGDISENGIAAESHDGVNLEDRIKAAAQGIEGKLQEVVGVLTKDAEMQEKGKVKQNEAAESIKES